MTYNKDTTADEITALLAAGTPASLTTTRDAAAEYIMPLVDAGLPVIPLKPNSRLPALDHSWQRTPITTEAWDQWLNQAFTGGDGDGATPVLGIGCRAGSAMIAADADTPGEVGALLSFLAAYGLPDAAPTVKTPGTPDRTHHGGGHWWFLLPPTIAVPAGLPGELKVDSAGRTGRDTQGDTFALFLYSKQAALPPTVRDPGQYRLNGQVHELPEQMGTWLVEQGKTARAEQDQREARRAERAERRAAGELSESDAAREAWEDATPWSSILTEAGWTETGTDPHCGCSQWRHPQASSSKSATAHDCARGTYLHMWSDSNDDLLAGSWSKLYVQAALHHGGNYATAANAAGLPSLFQPSVVMDLRARIAEMNEAGDPEEAEDLLYDPTEYPEGHPNDPQLLAEIFNLSPATRALYHDARNRSLSIAPVGLLLGELVRVAELAGPEAGYRIDGVLTPLSTFVAVASRTSSGKTTVTSTRPKLRRVGFGENMTENGQIERGEPASREALADMFLQDVPELDEDGKPTGRKTTQKRTPAVATVEVDELAGLNANRSTAAGIFNSLLTGWAGGALGGRSRTHQKREVKGPYVLNLVGGIQPARADFMVGRQATASGLTSRLVFTSPEDPWLRGIWAGYDPAAIPETELEALPKLPVGQAVSLPPTAFADLREDQLSAAEGTRAPEDGHSLQARLRLACLAALWHGETSVSEDLWEWSDAIMEHHRRARASVIVAAEVAAQDAADDDALRRERSIHGARDAVADDVARLASNLLPKIPAKGVASNTLRSNLSKPQRRHFAAAMQYLKIQGQVRQEDARGGGDRYFSDA